MRLSKLLEGLLVVELEAGAVIRLIEHTYQLQELVIVSIASEEIARELVLHRLILVRAADMNDRHDKGGSNCIGGR
ncbi:hypothetical protein CWO17_21475 [Vibrio sp. 10N.286.45.A3]|nr:hypothetical protein CWO17_21475 [Vibrio sp. 10N.286.45.A3]